MAHLYHLAKAGHYELIESVGPADAARVEIPFPVEVVPTRWVG